MSTSSAQTNRLHTATLATAGLGVLVAIVFRNGRRQPQDGATVPSNVQPHEAKQVKRDRTQLQALAKKLRPKLLWRVLAKRVDDSADIPDGCMKVHLIRHGQGHHNVAQAEWKAADKEGEPYWLSTDPGFRYGDAELTSVGEQQARALQARANKISPQLMVTSPMRRATQTGLIAFDKHVKAGELPVVAHESAHEIGGKHTCDKRLDVAELKALYPVVDYTLVPTEEDPLWLDGHTRESKEHLAGRGAELLGFLQGRPEKHVVVAAHSAFLLTLLNAVIEVEVDDDASWFDTGEMRTFVLEWLEVKGEGE